MSTPDPCTCQEAFERLDDYLVRELTAEEVERVEGHLAECVECAEAYLLEGKVLECIKRKLAQISIPKELAERIRTALDECEG